MTSYRRTLAKFSFLGLQTRRLPGVFGSFGMTRLFSDGSPGALASSRTLRYRLVAVGGNSASLHGLVAGLPSTSSSMP